MAVEANALRVLRLYPDDCQPGTLEPLLAHGGFSGASLWRLTSDRGVLCLRRWPAGHPRQERLEFIQAVLWHVDQEGFHAIPLPLETKHHHGYVWHEGHLWELTPWLPGVADYPQRPSEIKLHNALSTLADFHRAAASFPLPESGPVVAPGIAERLHRLETLLGGRIAEIRGAIDPALFPGLTAKAARLLELFAVAAPRMLPVLRSAARVRVLLQPCIRDIWHAHLLFSGDVVSGIVDFGSMRPENVAADVARLLGSLVGDDRQAWDRGMSAYESVRRLNRDELNLVGVFDRSTTLMGGLQWLEWIYLEHRTFAEPPAVLDRVDGFLARLAKLSQALG